MIREVARLKPLIALAALGVTLSGLTDAQSEINDPLAGDPEIPNYRRQTEELAFAGQPTPESFEKIKEAGFKTVLNIRPDREMRFDEKKVVEELGMTYLTIPITTKTITDEKVDSFAEIVDDPDNKPLLIHCAGSNRVGGMWYIYRALKHGVPEEESLEEAVAAGLRSPVLEQIVLKYVEERK
jgi:uncharacterized protein (TIGR01244 family)